MPELKDISFLPAIESDFEEFKSLRKSVMREHVERLGLPWNVWEEDEYHKEMFGVKGLRIILHKKLRVGFIGVREEDGAIILDRFCIERRHQNKGIGAAVMQKVFEEPFCQGKTIRLDVLRKNPAIRLYERLGFVFISEDDKLAYFQRRPTTESPQLNVTVPQV